MDKVLLVVAVLGVIAFLRNKLGDQSYEKIVLHGFAWLFGAVAVIFVAAVIYNRVLT